MKIVFIFFIFLFLGNCSKPKTVLICGDHVCVNKAEAEQYFEENLSIEVKVIDKKIKKKINLVELNLKEDEKGKRKIFLSSKSNMNKRLKTLSNNEIIKIKERIKEKKTLKKIEKNEIKTKNIIKKKETQIIMRTKKIDPINNKILNKNVNKKTKDIVDICTILEKCSIDEISKYLLEQGKKKNFPDLTTRQ